MKLSFAARWPHPAGLAAVDETGTVGRQTVVRSERRRRRPSGTPPPLPREMGRSGRVWAALIAAGIALGVAAALLGLAGSMERAESAFVARVAEGRSPWLTPPMVLVAALGFGWTNRIIRWSVIGVLVATRRWRHLLVFLATVLVVTWLASVVSISVGRPRPLGVTALIGWEGFSLPSRPVAALGVSLLGVLYTVVVPGRPRALGKWIVGGLLAALAVARLYLGVDHPTDAVLGLLLGAGIPLIAYRWLTPNGVFPVRYARGRAAHLDVGGRRGEAIRGGLRDQLGVAVRDIVPFGVRGSGGSTPLRLNVDADPPSVLFGKLYARSHLQADRWYKMGRTILYGSLEDERPYSSVRRLVQHEDYMLRVLRDAGIHVPRPLGFVEIMPEREYLLVTEFVRGVEIGEAEVDERAIDSALEAVRRMWDAGLAHRDLKPGNVLVRDGEVLLVDASFGEIRPSPWRQAVDLANMMLVLALRADPDLVYRRALRLFAPDDLAEAFAATRSVTIPSQVRAMLRRRRKEGDDVLARLRALAPRRRRIAIQRWSLQRIGVTAAVLFGALLAWSLLVQNVRSGAL